MLQDGNEIYLVIIAGTVMLLLLGMFIISFLFFYQRKRNNYIVEQKQQQAAFRQEILKAQVEMQEQTLAHISREIHDNITQVLSFIKLSLAITGKNTEGETKAKIDETRDLVAQTITDLRDLSKSLSFEHISACGLAQIIEEEVNKIKKSGLVDVSFIQEGEAYALGDQHELVLFRIFQEALNNSLKHSGAGHLKINLHYQPDLFNLSLEDDGSGFAAETLDNKSGSGLKNIENRAALIGGVAIIDSSPGKGCRVNVTLNPLKLQLYTDGISHPDRLG
jgi:signal transduction histidine kinase